jgi:hypothetical protein
MLMSTMLGLSAMMVQGEALNVAMVTAPANDCFYSTNCTNSARESLTPIVLPLTGSNGVLRTRVLTGATNAPAAGYFGYEYTVDLSGVLIATNHPVCLTNEVRCSTNRTETHTNRVTCATNLTGVVKSVTCVTNRVPATNILTCVTNFFPGTNIVRCFTNATGVVCVTNKFPATNHVVCTTTRFPARKLISCQTNVIDPGHFVVQCRTNRVEVHTGVVTCRTSLVNCAGSPPCITSLSLNVGRWITAADFNGDGTNEQIYVVAGGTNATNTAVSPSSIERVGGKLVLRFSPPLCAGQSSVTVGFVSTAPPQSAETKLRFTGGDKLKATAVGPKPSLLARCDFGKLAQAITQLRTREFLGASDPVREQRRSDLLANVQAAAVAATVNDEDGVASALAAVVTRVNGGTDDWVTRDGAKKIRDELKDLVDCLGGDDDDDGSEHHNDEDRD